MAVAVSEETFEKEVIEKSKDLPVVVDFWAPWCMPCRILGPIIRKIAEENKGKFILTVVNVDENPYLANAYGIRSIPTVIMFKEGKPVDTFTGALPEPRIKEWLKKNSVHID